MMHSGNMGILAWRGNPFRPNCPDLAPTVFLPVRNPAVTHQKPVKSVGSLRRIRNPGHNNASRMNSAMMNDLLRGFQLGV